MEYFLLVLIVLNNLTTIARNLIVIAKILRK